jgi:hypothetical protein
VARSPERTARSEVSMGFAKAKKPKLARRKKKEMMRLENIVE